MIFLTWLGRWRLWFVLGKPWALLKISDAASIFFCVATESLIKSNYHEISSWANEKAKIYWYDRLLFPTANQNKVLSLFFISFNNYNVDVVMKTMHSSQGPDNKLQNSIVLVLLYLAHLFVHQNCLVQTIQEIANLYKIWLKSKLATICMQR